MESSVDLPSNRKFGILFSVIFLLLSWWAYSVARFYLCSVLLLASLIFIFFSIFFPEKLLSLNRLWFRFGLLLAKIFNPIILGVIFFLLITPVAVVTKIFGRDELGIKLKFKKSSTYWKSRDPVGPDADSFKNQY